ncbi:hypothetical protein [Streptomyces sp. CBMA123]|uniref:hypothetical protein n=1 Tax=Streptomyces sp. CBMA123 TaxID=1896313 RepID=UPI001661EDAC|nr:hypothetical protein [Streptomyces sp. CBMA123]MBD0688658.1 hypothetical protein [Streptomyces sp. CBMA123]
MASQQTGTSRRPRSAFTQSQSAEQPTRHPAVALAMALPCAVLLVLLFGGWEQMANQAEVLAELIGR